MTETEHREALVIGINRYPLTKQLQDLEKPAADAEAVAQLLEKYGNFKVQRLPEVYSPEGKREVDPNPHPTNQVTGPILEEAIAQLFNPSGKTIPDTALLFFAGHGLRKAPGDVTEGFLATSDVNLDKGKWGVSLRWLRELLQKSPVRQQIIWLDCCHSGELLNILDEANPGQEGKALDRCLIAACREFEVSREQLQGEHGILTAALLQGLEPDRDVDGFVTNYKLADFINKEMSAESQRPIFHNSGNAIILTDKMLGRQRQVDANLVGTCPYKALEYFTQEDAVFFYGRTALTDELIDKVRTQNFIAVLGASGSGKSSVLRAGLLYQLKRGQKLSGSDRWTYYDPFTPGGHPLASLKNAISKDGPDLSQFIQTSPSDSDPPQPPLERGENAIKVPQPPLTKRENAIKVPLLKGDLGGSPDLTTHPTVETERVVLVIDQFEECFTMCQDSQEREEFFKCLLETLEQAKHKLCLVLGLRADFLGKCAEYAELAQKIDQHLVMVKPMSRQEIEEAITKPAELVDLQVEKALVTKMTEDVVESPGSLPLLQYTLTQLWKDAQTGANRDRLTLDSYNQFGGIEKTLPKRANQVYASLKEEEKPVAKRIFLELTQLGETSDTRRRICKEDLVNPQHSEELLDRTIEQLVQAKLIVTTNESQSHNAKPGVILDIVHEALIRHWQELRQWVVQNQVALDIERKIEARAKDWERNGKTEDLGLLLQGATLIEAETYLKDYGNLGLLDGIAQEYIQVSQTVRDRRRRRNIIISTSVFTVLSILTGVAGSVWWFSEFQRRQSITNLTAASQELFDSNKEFDALLASLNAAKQVKQAAFGVNSDTKLQVQVALQQAVYGVKERNRLEGHKSGISNVIFNANGRQLASFSGDNNIKLWNAVTGQEIASFSFSEQAGAKSFSPDGQLLAFTRGDAIKIWDITTISPKEIVSLPKPRGYVNSISVSPNKQLLALVINSERKIKVWDIANAREIATLTGYPDWIFDVSFSPDGRRLASADGGRNVKLWDIATAKEIAKLTGHRSEVLKVSFSPDGQLLASAGWDTSIKLWNVATAKEITTLTRYGGGVYNLAFSPDSRRLASAYEQGNVELWNIHNANNAKKIATLNGHRDGVRGLSFSPDGRLLASGSNDQTIKLWDVASRQEITALTGHTNRISGISFSPNGNLLASASVGNKSFIKLWDVASRQEITTLTGHKASRNSISFSHDGQTIASADQDKIITLWDVTNRQNIATISTRHSHWIDSISFSPTEPRLASGSWEGTVKLWNIATRKEIATLKAHGWGVTSVSYSHDGRLLASASYDQTIKLWDVTTRQEIGTLTGHKAGVNSVSFSPDGRLLASASDDKSIKLWDVATRKEIATLKGHMLKVNSVSFSRDGRQLVSASSDRSIIIWDVATGKKINVLNGHKTEVKSVSFSRDGQLLASGSANGTVILWNYKILSKLTLDDLLARGCDWVRGYLQTNPNVRESDRHLCDGIGTGK
jgi:WD40 repeat protein